MRSRTVDGEQPYRRMGCQRSNTCRATDIYLHEPAMSLTGGAVVEDLADIFCGQRLAHLPLHDGADLRTTWTGQPHTTKLIPHL